MILVKRFVLLAFLWLVLTGNDPGAWAVGGLAAASAAWLSLRLLPPTGRRVRILATLALAPGFLGESLRGGIDVARRAFHPGLPLNPDWIRYPLRLPPGPARAVLGGEISLMPGTLAAGGDGEHLLVHLLDRNQPHEEALAEEERRIAGSFGLTLEE